MQAEAIRTALAEIEEATYHLRTIIAALNEAILALPDNPKIKRLAPNCFAMQASDLSNRNWSPEYYDFKYQYLAVAEGLLRTNVLNALPMLRHIIATGNIRRGTTIIKLHDDVRKHLNDLVG